MTKSEAGKLGAEKTKLIIKNRYNNNPKHCVCCEYILPYEKRKNKFCNQSCSASFNNLGVRRNGSQGNKFCLFCESKLIGKKYVNKYCSVKCNKDYLWLRTKQKILNTGFFCSSSIGKRYLKETKGCKCEICGICEWDGKILSLILDHINGNPEDWSVENLRLLCPNCDSLTPTFKGRNRGNGRFSRRRRYRERKSY